MRLEIVVPFIYQLRKRRIFVIASYRNYKGSLFSISPLHRCFSIVKSWTGDIVKSHFLMTTSAEQRERDTEDAEEDIESEHFDAEEELRFDPTKDLWISVRVDTKSLRDSTEDSCNWVWEVITG